MSRWLNEFSRCSLLTVLPYFPPKYLLNEWVVKGKKRCHACGQQSIVLKRYTVYSLALFFLCNLTNGFIRTRKNSVAASKADGEIVKMKFLIQQFWRFSPSNKLPGNAHSCWSLDHTWISRALLDGPWSGQWGNQSREKQLQTGSFLCEFPLKRAKCWFGQKASCQQLTIPGLRV